jgi:hypothetical protein
LKAERERRGIALSEIEASTKVKAAFLAGLEANDLSRWPTGGVYRRAFIRDYAAAVGLPLASTLAEFDRLFPDLSPSPFGLPPAPPTDRAANLRLTLATEAHTRRETRRRETPARSIGAPLRIAAALVDLGGVLLLAFVATRLTHLDSWIGISLAGFCYHLISTLCLGQSVGVWWLATRAAGNRVGLLESRANSQTMAHDVQGSPASDEQLSRIPRSAKPGGLNWRSEWGRRTQAWVMRGVWRTSAAWAVLLRQSQQATSILSRMLKKARGAFTLVFQQPARALDRARLRTVVAPAIRAFQRHRERYLSFGVVAMATLVVILYNARPGDRGGRGDVSASGAPKALVAAPQEAVTPGQTPAATAPAAEVQSAVGEGSSGRTAGKPSPRLKDSPPAASDARARRAAGRRHRGPRAAALRRSNDAAEAPQQASEQGEASVAPASTAQEPAPAADDAPSVDVIVPESPAPPDPTAASQTPRKGPAVRSPRRGRPSTPRPAQR